MELGQDVSSPVSWTSQSWERFQNLSELHRLDSVAAKASEGLGRVRDGQWPQERT